MNEDVTIVQPEICQKCKVWGTTISDHDYAVVCPDCQRRTHPNLGVNLPAGAAVAVGTANAIAAMNPKKLLLQLLRVHTGKVKKN